MKIYYQPKRGEFAGKRFTPHQFPDGRYVVAKRSNLAKDQIRVPSLDEVLSYLDRGYSLRMSHPAKRTRPGLIRKDSMVIDR